MSYLKYLDHEGLANILICPHCGGESFTPKMESSLRCNGCELWFFITNTNFQFNKFPAKTVHASVKPMRSNDDWDWRLTVKEGPVMQWITWDEQHKDQRTDTRSYEEIKTLMNNKWDAYKVAKALTSSFKKQGGMR